MYSGKQQDHTIKNTLITDAGRYIHFLGTSTQGSTHDLALLCLDIKEDESKSATVLRAFSRIWVDLGYLAIGKHFALTQLMQPHKKPKGGQLTPQQKQENARINAKRVVVEHAIAGLKRFDTLTQRFRSRVKDFENQVINCAAAIWNLHLILKIKTINNTN